MKTIPEYIAFYDAHRRDWQQSTTGICAFVVAQVVKYGHRTGPTRLVDFIDDVKTPEEREEVLHALRLIRPYCRLTWEQTSRVKNILTPEIA